MLKAVSRLAAGVLMMLALVQPTQAKVPLQRMTISGGGLAEPLTIADQITLHLSNPWHERFVHWSLGPVVPPTDDSETYEVTLYARLRSPEIRPIYQFRYAKGKDGGPGYVYFPGNGEPWWQQNVSIIYRQGQYGRWHPAASEWEARIRKVLAQ